MKKTICIILFIVIIYWVFVDKSFVKSSSIESKTSIEEKKDINLNEELKKSLSSKLIRFHVVANSDSVEDQALKLKVRDAVLDYISPKLKKSNSIDESREILKKEDKSIKDIATKVIKENGYNYAISTTLTMENFPVKSYGNITLPQGKYEAYRIIIASGKGQNWWCVMFPPLCFIDTAKSETSNKKTEVEMKKVLNDKEYEMIDSSKDSSQSMSSENKNEIKIKFKLFEIIKSLKGKVYKNEKTKEVSEETKEK